MAKQFQQGDIVQLVSGGPEMTVEEADDHMPEDAPIKCQWFKGEKLSDGWFVTASLKLIRKRRAEN
jgi:uncharacterized protein YodC (DUF2158 family)